VTPKGFLLYFWHIAETRTTLFLGLESTILLAWAHAWPKHGRYESWGCWLVWQNSNVGSPVAVASSIIKWQKQGGKRMYSTRCVEPLHGYTGPERLISDGVAQPARRGHVRVVRRKQPPDGSMRDDGISRNQFFLATTRAAACSTARAVELPRSLSFVVGSLWPGHPPQPTNQLTNRRPTTKKKSLIDQLIRIPWVHEQYTPRIWSNKRFTVVKKQEIYMTAFFFTPSYRIFRHMHGGLKVDKKKLITQFGRKSRDKSFKPN
jgi:hypothetical protein